MKSLIIITTLILPGTIFSQRDSTKARITLSGNVVQALINELGGYMDFCPDRTNSIGIGFASEYGMPNDVFPLSPSQDNFPGRVWHGIVARVNYKFFFDDADRWYVCPQLIYKSLSFNNQHFDDDFLNQGNVTYTRSETAHLFGLDFFFGKLISKPNSRYYSDIFFGAGYRSRTREGITSDVNPIYVATAHNIYNGSYLKEQNYVTFIFGLKIGLNAFFKI